MLSDTLNIEERDVLHAVEKYTEALTLLDRNNALFVNGEKVISDGVLVAITLMIAESNPLEKDIMAAFVMNLLKADK